MEVTVEDKGKCRKELNIEVPVEAIKEEYDSIVNYFRQNVALPGFRKGKAPLPMVQTKFKKDIEKELHEKMLPKSFHQAIQQEKLKVEQVIDIEEGDFAPDQAFKFKVIMDVKPEVNLPEYKGISLDKEAAEVKDEDIEGTIDNLRQQLAKYEDVTDPRAVVAGDLVQINFEGKVGEESIKDLAESASGIGEGEDFWVRADENAFIPEFADGMVGVDMGGKTVIDVTFPEDFAVEELRGKAAKYDVEVIGIRERILPELDEEFCKRVGTEGEEDLRDQIKKDLESQMENAQKNKMMGQLQEWLLETIPVEIPESTLQQETQQNIQDIVRQSTSSGESEDTIKENKDQIFENAQAAASKTIQMRYILASIAEQEKITASSKEVTAEIERMAQVYSVDAKIIKERIAQNGSEDMIQADVVARKTMDFLFDNAEIKG
jgi:trigger factor